MTAKTERINSRKDTNFVVHFSDERRRDIMSAAVSKKAMSAISIDQCAINVAGDSEGSVKPAHFLFVVIHPNGESNFVALTPR
jgi:hypothetical protein